jgi:hypothetical protein
MQVESQNTETGEKSEVGEGEKVFRPSITTTHEKKQRSRNLI